MKSRLTFTFLLILAAILDIYAQNMTPVTMQKQVFPDIVLDNYADLFKNNVADGPCYRFGSIANINVRDYNIKTGVLWTLPHKEEIRFAGWFINASGNFHIRRFVFETELFYRTNLFSSGLRETNFGFVLGHQGRHFRIELGNNYRIYKYREKITDRGLNDDGGNTITEPRNLMYSFTWFVLPVGHSWNAELSVTNFDHFIIQQETNPMLSLKIPFKLNPGLTVYTELWYETAGMLNLQMNYFGYCLRTGLAWKIK